KKRAIDPARHTPLMKLRPRRASGRRTSSTFSPLAGGSSNRIVPDPPLRESHVDRIRARGIVEGNGAVGLAVHELLDQRELGAADLVGRSLADDHALGYEIEIVDDLHRLD